MPSLRRSSSSSSVRSSPYASTASGVVARGHGHRRSSGSDTATRRVLADIEWWRVTDGQRDLEADQESEERAHDDQDTVVVGDAVDAPTAIPVAVAGAEPDIAPSPWIPDLTVSSPETLRSGFAALSISPHTPTRRRHSRASSSSSLESTPEATESALESMSDIDLGFLDASLPPLRSSTRDYRLGSIPPLIRSHTFADCISLFSEHPRHYADFAVSPLSSSPDFLN